MKNNKLRKIDISKNLSRKKGFSISLSKKIIDDLLNIFIKNIKNGELNIKNIGKFKLINKNQRMGRNPKTKENFLISSRKSISFSPSKHLLNSININNE